MNELNNDAPRAEVRPAARTNKGNLEYKTAGMLCYVPIMPINIIAPILWMATEPKENKYLRFHAIQGLAIAVSAIILGVISNIIAVSMILTLGSVGAALFGSLSWLIGVAYFAASVYGMYCCYTGKDFRVPILAEIADQNV